MKNIFIVTFLLVSCTSFCQTGYLPIVTPANEWIVDWAHASPGWPTEIRRYTFSADSVLIDGKYYHELIYSINMSSGPWISGGFLREESGRTYKWIENMPEHLIYDFNFGIGDSLPGLVDLIGQASRYVTQVGSTQLMDGTPRKKITFNSSCGESEWVEGIGEIGDFLYSEVFCSLWDGVPLNIRCFSTNGQLLYLHPDLSGCYTSAVADVEMGAIRVYPNPASDILYAEAENEEEIGNVLIYNSLGKLALVANNLSPQINSMDVSTLPSGFYTGLVNFRAGGRQVFKVAIAK